MSSASRRYKEQQIKNASPTELITILYDMCIQACYAEDANRVHAILSQLVRSLNFDYDAAGDFYSIYEYCQRLSRKGDFDQIVKLISDIRDTWDEVVVKGSKQNKRSLNISG